MKNERKKQFARLSLGFMASAWVTISPVHAGWLMEEQKLTASAAAEDDRFGHSVAISGDTALVTATQDGGENSSSVYVFVRSGDTWEQQAKLVALDVNEGDSFGTSIAISGDTAVVGVPGYGSAGAVYTFTREGVTWSGQKIEEPSAGEGDHFGSSVDISGDIMVVSAPGTDANRPDPGEDNDYRYEDAGRVYVFIRTGATWVAQFHFDLPDPDLYRSFGQSVAVSNETVVVGARGQGGIGGAAYVYTRSEDRYNPWNRTRLVAPPNLTPSSFFASSVAVSDDTVVVGTDEGALIIPGSVYVYVPSGDTWTRQAKLMAHDAELGDRFGRSVAISGNTIVVGREWVNDDNYPEGASYFFIRSTTTWSPGGIDWGPHGKLKALEPQYLDAFGNAVAISGKTVVVGAEASWTGAGGVESGSAYVFDLSCDSTYTLPSNQWHQISLPCLPGTLIKVSEIFGDDIPGTYGTDWKLYDYDVNGYVALNDFDRLGQGKAYWIIQNSGSDVVLDMPESGSSTPVSDPIGCLASAAKGCFEIPLATQANRIQWNMVGYPFASSGSLGNVRVQTDTGVCASGCGLDTAQSQGIIHNQLWAFNGAHFEVVDTSGSLEPWGGYWLATLQSAEGLNPRLLLAKP